MPCRFPRVSFDLYLPVKDVSGRSREPHGTVVLRPARAENTPPELNLDVAMREGAPLPVGLEEARASVELCTAIYASALSGRPVKLPIDATHPQYRGVTADDYNELQRGRPRPAAVVDP